MRKLFISGVLALSLIASASSSYAASTDPRLISSHGDWSAYMYEDNGTKVCFMSSQPTKAVGKYKKRGDVYMFITHWTADRSYDVVSVAAGYGYKTGSNATITVDGKKYTLFTQKEMAWTHDPKTDKALAKAVRKGSRMVVKGVSSRGTKTTDTYSLKGSGAAYKAISKACKVSY